MSRSRVPSSDTTLAEFFDHVYRPRKDLSEGTAKKYFITVRHFQRFLKRAPIVADLNEDAIADFLYWFKVGPKGERRPDTVWGARKHLVALGNYAYKKGLLPEAPDVRRIQCTHEPPEAYTLDELSRLMRAAKAAPGVVNGIEANLFWPALFLLGYYTGMRRGTLFGLRMVDVDLVAGVVHAPARIMKNGRAQDFRIPAECVEAIRAMGEPDREYLFPWSRSLRTIYYYLHKIHAAAGLPSGRRDLLHKLRRTCATLMHRLGADATAQLGHSSDVVTRRHYLDISSEKQAGDILPSPL